MIRKGVSLLLMAGVALCVAAPPVLMLRRGVPENWFAPDGLALWLAPLLLALCLLAVLFRLARR